MVPDSPIEGERRVANPIKVGVLAFPQYTDWPSLQRVGQRVDELGYDSLWTWDHLYPIQGDWRGPIFEGFMTLAGWASVTTRVTTGLMVGANPFRNPALVAKMVTQLDHMTHGRAVLGIGGAWFEREHRAYGIEFGRSPGERLGWLDEAVPLIRAMLLGEEGTARGPRYQARAVTNDPPPIQARVPILIGGSGERKTLRIVAQYADMWEVGGDPDFARHKDEVLRSWCEKVSRDPSEIERLHGSGGIVIRDDMAAARRIAESMKERNPGYRGPGLIGSPSQVAETLAPFLDLGIRHIFYDAPAPYDDETLERFVGEVKPMLERHAGTADS
jgi:alkanesulfonate monooxygenase SsuD/methylene tetrahydromethanopterin reductase-like flavin-dependent oxidoreductase (luciferase family)